MTTLNEQECIFKCDNCENEIKIKENTSTVYVICEYNRDKEQYLEIKHFCRSCFIATEEKKYSGKQEYLVYQESTEGKKILSLPNSEPAKNDSPDSDSEENTFLKGIKKSLKPLFFILLVINLVLITYYYWKKKKIRSANSN